jgi:hypothetical protein
MAANERPVRGTVEDALRVDTVKLLETDPQEYVRKTRKPPFGFVLTNKDQDQR